MGDLPLRTPADRRHGGPSPRRQANPTRPHLQSSFMRTPCGMRTYRVLILISKGYPRAGAGWTRVTHPFAGRQHQKQAFDLLPLDLHVLGL